MDIRTIRVVEVAPTRVASALGFGPEPEPIAINTLLTWANQHGLLKPPINQRFFGFNNPSPSAGSPNYGYEQWITVPEGLEGNENVEIKQFSGGLYAVGRCESLENIMQDWCELVAWQEKSQYLPGSHQWLEEILCVDLLPGMLKGEFNPASFVLDLYLPIIK